jgi:hypothetical protein
MLDLEQIEVVVLDVNHPGKCSHRSSGRRGRSKIEGRPLFFGLEI